MDYLNKKQLLLRSILDNTQAQTKLIKEGHVDALEALIGQRAAIMAQVDELDEEAREAVGKIPSEEMEPIKNLLSHIITIDNDNQSLMKKEVVHIQGELRKIRAGRQQEQHYGTEYGVHREEGIFFDTKE